jgi:hypothetical protein
MTHMRQAGLRWHWLPALAIIAGLVALAAADDWGPGGMFSRWSRRDEITSLRTEDSKTFDNHDGTRSVVIAGPMHRQVAPGVWQDAEDTVQVGDETHDEPCMWYIGANYFRCQHLYLGSELNFSGYITKIAFWSDSAGSDTLNQSYHWLRDVSDTAFDPTDSWINEGTEVWDSNLVRSDPGWNILPLQTRFFHARGSNLLVSYRHADDSRESLYKCYRASYQGLPLIRAHWGYSASNPQPPLQPSAWRANILITYAPLSETIDVQTLAILAPTDSVLWGQPCVPMAVVRNNGIYPADFPVQFRIGDGYVKSVDIHALQPEVEDTVSFSSWTPGFAGWLSVQCSTGLAGDQNAENDTLSSLVFVVYHDVGVGSILAPSGIVPLGDSVLPVVMARDYGTWNENTWVVTRILRDSAVVYTDSVEVSLLPTSEVLVPLSRYWLAESLGAYEVAAWTSLPGDMNPSNDTAHSSVQVQRLSRHDIGVSAIVAPAGTVDSGETIASIAQITNLGDFPQSGTVRFSISDSPPYRCSVFVNALLPDSTRAVTFPPWIARRIGTYNARCSLEFAPDDYPANDTLSRSFVVEEPTPWHQMTYLPEGGQHKNARGGAALASDEADLVYALKGNGTREFYAYHLTGDSWSRCCSIPRAQGSARSAALCHSPGTDRVYAASANSSEFCEYRPEDNAWSRRADIPAGISGLRPGLGAGLATMDTGLVYLLKGGGTRELWVYDPAHDTWFRRAQAPAGSSGKGYRTGSCMVAVRDYLYLLKGGCNEFFAYSTLDDTWYNRMPLPMTGAGGKRKPARAGAAMAHDHDVIYVLKGGKCGELWWYDTFGDSWVEQRSLPLGSDWRPVADGGALAFAAGRLWCLRGNNTREFWAYQPRNADRYPPSAVGAASQPRPQFAVRIAPNPFTRSATISCSLPMPGEVSLKLFDVNGRLVRTLCSGQRQAGTLSVELTGRLPPGVYLLRFLTTTQHTTCQLIRE